MELSENIFFSCLQCREDAEQPVWPAVNLPALHAARLDGASSGDSMGR